MNALSAQHLGVSLGGAAVLHGIDVGFEAGHWTAIVGPNGAGKSTLLKALAGLIPASGKINLFDRELASWPLKQKAQQLAWLGQGAASPSAGLSVYDTVMLGRLPHQNWLALPSAADHAAVVAALHRTQAWDWRQRSASALSGGEHQRVLLARLLAVQAPLMLMDEPLANLDPPHQADWVNTVRGLVGQGATVVTVLHEISVALAADNLLILDAGRVLHSGSCTDPTSHRALEAVFAQKITVHSENASVFARLKLGHVHDAAF